VKVPASGGVLPVDKPEGPTSHDVVARARRALRTRKIGHTGTLDPFATGLLLLCVGPATRLSPFLTGLDKRYEAEALLGVETDTLDRDGRVVARHEGVDEVSDDAVAAAVGALTGPLSQVPPIYSAKKIRGEAAHRRVRRGEEVELEAVRVNVRSFRVLDRDGPRLRMEVVCSSGTYIRALARDLGRALGVGAHLTALRRTGVGDFTVGDAVGLEDLDAGEALPWIRPADALRRAGMPAVALPGTARAELAQGRVVTCPASDAAGWAAGVCDGELLAVGEVADGRFQPRRVFVAS
jgi:tRNA pseudouridine55 synthase